MLSPIIRNIRNKAGATLGEVLIVVAIISILTALAVPAVLYIRNMLHQTALDNTAREIFVAAQNKLSGMKSCGLNMPEGITMGKEEPSDFSETGLTWTNTGSLSDVYVYCSSEDNTSSWLDDTSYAPNDTDGKYIIEFNRSTGDVYGVFYWEDFTSGFSRKGSFQYPQDYNDYTDEKDNKFPLRGDSNKSNRMKLFVGYYGSSGVDVTDKGSFDYSLAINNTDKLSLSIIPDQLSTGMDTEYTVEISSATNPLNTNKYTYRIEYKNGAAFAVDDNNSATSLSIAYPNVTSDITDFSFNIVLDSLEGNMHFADLCPKIQAGDDIKVTVNAIYIGSKGFYTQKDSEEGQTNSLFDERQNFDGTPNSQGDTIQISNGRHLQNMAYEISNLGHTADGNATPYTIKSAVLNKDVDWSYYNDINTKWTSPALLSSFYPISNVYADTSDSITYGMDTGITSFDGKHHEIKNLNVTLTKTLTDAISKSDNPYNNKKGKEYRAASGLFAFMYNVGTIKDFTMSDAYVKNDFSDSSYKNGTAALCGFVSSTLNSKNKNGTVDKDMTGTIENISFVDCTVEAKNTDAGMAVGCISMLGNEADKSNVTDGLIIKKCSSYLDDKNSDEYYQKNISSSPNYAVKSDSGNAGGLVGLLEYGVAEISDSYSAVNVYSSSNTGGIIGSSYDKLQIQNCYSSCDITASSSSDGAAGGIAGKIGGGWIKLNNCLTTCDVYGEHYSGGAFGYINISDNVCSSASVDVSDCLSYGTVTWQNKEVCLNSSNLTLSGACSGGFAGRIERTDLAKSTFSMKTCRYLSMKGYNNSNPGDSANINGYGYDYSGYSNINIIPSLYENDLSGKPYMPPASLSATQQKSKTHPYSSDLKNYAFPFKLITASDNSVLDYYGNWPQKGNIETALCYYEKYGNGSETKYGYYAVTTLGSGQSAWTLDTLMSQKDLDSSGFYLTEDGYALISSYDIGQFGYVFDSDIDATKKEGTISVADGDATKSEAGKIVSGEKLTFSQDNADELTTYANIYKLPFFLQEMERDKVMEFYDKLDISYTAYKKYDDNGNLKDINTLVNEINAGSKQIPADWTESGGTWQASDNYTFYYCCHFSKTAINPYVGRSTAHRPERTSKIYVRSPRQLNALGRYCYYWNSENNSKWNKYTFLQELDLNYSTYTKNYCGTSYDMSPGGNYQNMPIGRTSNNTTYIDKNGNTVFYSNFQNDYDGQNHKIINFKMNTESLYYVGLFGEIYNSTIKNINMCIDDKIEKGSQYGSGYIIATYTYGKLKVLNGSTGDSQAHNYALGALVGKVTGSSSGSPLIENCSVSGYTLIGKMSNEKTCVSPSTGKAVEINKFPASPARNFAFHVGGLVGFNNGYILSCTAENKLVKFTYAHPYSDNNLYGREKTVGGLAGSNQGVIDGCYAGGNLEIDCDSSASYGIDTAKSGFYIGGIAGTNCYAGYGYELGFVSYQNASGKYKGSLIADSYSFCGIQKNGTVNNYVPSSNIYGTAWTTDKNTSLNDYSNKIKVYDQYDINKTGSYISVSENIANCYYLNETIDLGQDSSGKINPADSNWNMENSQKAGLSYSTMSKIADFSAVLNSGTASTYTYSQGLSAISPNTFSSALSLASFPYSDNLSGLTYPFAAVIKNNGNYEHYGNWPLHTSDNIGLCYWEKYDDGSTGLYIYGIDTENYSGGDPNYANTAGVWFVNTLKYDNSSIVTDNGYLWAAQGSADVSGLERTAALNVNGYSFYKILASQNTDGIVRTTLPNTQISAFYNPDFASSIRLGTYGKYADQFDSYQIRTISEFEKTGLSQYNNLNFEQTINITSSKTYGYPYIIPEFYGVYDGKGRRDDGVRTGASTPNESYKITFTSPLTFNVYKMSNTMCAGIFGTNYGTLKNMDVSGSIICSYENCPYNLYIGGLVGSNITDSSGNNGNVICCTADMDITLKNYDSNSGLGMTCIGGLIGQNISGGDCFGNAALGKVAYNSDIYMNNGSGNILAVGGFVGYNSGNISSSYSMGSVCEGTSVKEGSPCAAGGFVGESISNISACYSTGNVSKAVHNCGQFAGFCYNNSVYNSCYGWASNSNLNFFSKYPATFNNCYCFSTSTSSSYGITYMPSWNQSIGNLKDSDIEPSLGLHWKYDETSLTPVFSKHD